VRADLVRLPWRAAGAGVRLSLGSMRWTERLVLGALQARMAAVAALPPAGGATAGASNGTTATASPSAELETLLERSLVQSANHGRDEFYAKLLHELVPDEARILSALSDGSPAALVHIERRRVLTADRRRLENASSIGRTAALTLPHLTSTYITHLLRLGLVEIGPEAPECKLDYEALLAERPVREALKDAETGPVPPRTLRRTLRLSPLGQELWLLCSSGTDHPR
jgi:Abortive infection alpha